MTTVTESERKCVRIYTSIKLIICAGPLVHKISYIIVIATPEFPQKRCLFTFLNIFYLVICFLLGNSPASEFYWPTFRNLCQFHLHRQVDEV